MLKLYNTLTKQKEEFEPIEKGKVSLYTCGPTVYNYQHIGNYKSFMTADILRRYLEYSGFEVRHIQNITDVGHLTDDDVAQGDSGEDKMVKKALAEKKSPEEIARFFEKYHIDTSEKLNILAPQFAPRATEHIPLMIKLIEQLIDKGHAYETNGNVFLDVTSYENYGKLSGNTLEDLNVGARLTEPHPDKRNQWDFALWLKAPEDHLMQWDSPWGRGYPGWHIECSAMCIDYLGETIDIHTGGEDHIFPHHEAEIAQSEGATGKPFVHYWMHTRHMLVDGKKMSKSKGNFYILEDVIAKGYSATDLRFTYLLAHYRSQMNFTWESLSQAHKNLESLQNFRDRLSTFVASQERDCERLDTEIYRKDFEEAMNDDLNTPLAISVLLRMVTDGNVLMDDKKLHNPEVVLKAFEKLTNILGIIFNTATIIPQEVLNLAKKRDEARASKEFSRADGLRDEIIANGYIIEDTPTGTKVKEKK